jgi:hypothetical protein
MYVVFNVLLEMPRTFQVPRVNEGRPETEDRFRTALTCRLCLGRFPLHPPYSPDLGPSDFHLFTHLNQFLGGTRMRSDKVKKTVKHWFSGLAAD